MEENKELEKYKYLYNKALSELVVADKIIDEMLQEYEYNASTNIKSFCDEEMRKNMCIQDCRCCIKQYFQKKVSEE